VHLLSNGGVAANRLSVIGLGEWHPIAANDTVEGRNANRRVLLVILSGAADSPDNNAQPLPDIDRNEPVQERATPGESAAPVSPATASATLPTAAAASTPGMKLPPVGTSASN
jgi:chemotaxis protein MotB